MSRVVNRAYTDYDIEWNQPLKGEYRGHHLWTVPAPASGSIWLNVMGVLEQFDVQGSGTVADLHHMTEALRVSDSNGRTNQACIRNPDSVGGPKLCARPGGCSRKVDLKGVLQGASGAGWRAHTVAGRLQTAQVSSVKASLMQVPTSPRILVHRI